MLKHTVAPLLITAAFIVSACSKRDEAPPVAPQPASPASAGIAPGGTSGPSAAATPLVVPLEDRIEPASIENARLPGGGVLLEAPPSKTDKNKTNH